MPHVWRAKAAEFSGGVTKKGDGTGHLLLDGAEMLAGAYLRGICEQVQAISDGFDVSKGLAQLVHQLHEDGF